MANNGAIRAGGAFVELFADDSKLVRGLKSAQKKMQAWGSSMTAIGTKVFAGGAGLAGGLAATTTVFADVASQLDDMSQRTGVAASVLSELGFVAGVSGTDLETVESSIRKMQKALVEAGQGAEGPTDALKNLGLTVGDLQGLSPDEQFMKIGDAISQLQDPAKQTAAAMEIFGKSGVAMKNIFNEGAAGVEKMRQRAKELGVTLSDDAALAGAAFGDQMDEVWMQVKAVAVQLGSALVPVLSEFVGLLSSGLSSVIAWVKENGELIRWVLYGTMAVAGLGAAVVAVGAVFTTVGAILGGVATVIGAIGTAIGFLLTPIGAVIAGLTGLAAYFLFATEQGDATLSYLGQAFDQLATDAGDAFGAIGDALAMGDIQQAAKVLWAFLKLIWVQGTNFLQGVWDGLTGYLGDALFNTQNWISQQLISAWAGLQTMWLDVCNGLAGAWSWFCNTAADLWAGIQDTVAAGWDWLASQFDETVDAEARAAERLAGRNKEAKDKADAAIAEERARQKATSERLRQINSDERGALKALEGDKTARNNKKAKERSAAEEAAQAEADKARAEFQNAVDETKQKKKEFDLKSKTGPDRLKKPGIPTPEEVMGKVEASKTSGTFSAAAAGRLGGQSQIAVLNKQLDAANMQIELLKAQNKIWGNVRNLFTVS